MLANHRYEELSYPKNQKMCNPIPVSLLKMQPHDSQSSHENASPSSCTSSLASYKEVPPGGGESLAKTTQFLWKLCDTQKLTLYPQAYIPLAGEHIRFQRWHFKDWRSMDLRTVVASVPVRAPSFDLFAFAPFFARPECEILEFSSVLKPVKLFFVLYSYC